MASLAAARAAKADLAQKLQGQPWFRGVGITQLKCMGPDPYELQINVDTRASYDQLTSCSIVPKNWMGVPITFSIVGDIVALEGVSLTSQDYANIALGAMTMTATFLVGKIIVNSIIESRKEHFDAKGQPPAAVKARETTLDGIVKVFGMGYSMYLLSQELPIVIAETRKFLK